MAPEDAQTDASNPTKVQPGDVLAEPGRTSLDGTEGVQTGYKGEILITHSVLMQQELINASFKASRCWWWLLTVRQEELGVLIKVGGGLSVCSCVSLAPLAAGSFC